jgi:hypothetical protein
MKHLTPEQIGHLAWISEEEGFAETIDEHVGFIKLAIKLEKQTRQNPKAVRKELKRMMDALSGLSDQAREHIAYHMTAGLPDSLESEIAEAKSVLDKISIALKQEYSNPGKVPLHKRVLMRFLRQLDRDHEIQPRDGEWIAKIICQAAGISCGNTIYWRSLHHEDSPKRIRRHLTNLFKHSRND